MPVLNGTNHEEERIFVSIGLTVSQGTDVPIAHQPVNPGNYQANISAALGVTAARAAEYPLSAYPFPWVAFSTLVRDASFACPVLQIDQETSYRVPTAPVPVRPAQRALPHAAQPRPAGARSQHASGLGALRRHRHPTTAVVPWPSFGAGSAKMLSLIPP